MTAVSCLSFFVVMSKLNDEIITGFDSINDFFPVTFKDKTARRTTVKSMVIHSNILCKEALQRHSPASFLSFTYVFVCHSTIAYHVDSEVFVG